MDDSAGFVSQLESLFAGTVVAALESVIFFDLWFWDGGPGQSDDAESGHQRTGCQPEAAIGSDVAQPLEQHSRE